MKSSSNSSHSRGVPDFAPSDIASDTARQHFERGAQPTIERNRWFLIAVILGVGHLIHPLAYNHLFPLKQVEPYAVTKAEGGRLVVDDTPIGRWTPDKDSLAYHVNQWARDVYDINRSTIERTLRSSTSIAIGNAVAQLRELRYKDNPMVHLRDNPDFTRTYEYKSINWVKDDVALLRFKTITRINGTSTERHYVMSITFTLIKPKTREQLVVNPAGLYITNFDVEEERVK